MKCLTLFILLLGSLILSGQENRELIVADSLFCDMALHKGTRAAFVYYVADSAVRLVENEFPLINEEVRKQYAKSFGDTTIIVWWHPLKQWLNPSADIGYTYGVWKRTKTTDKIFLLEGTYYTLWKKQANGSWKFIFDTGEVGLPKLPVKK